MASALGWSTQRNRLEHPQGLLPLGYPAERDPPQPGQRTGVASSTESACPRKFSTRGRGRRAHRHARDVGDPLGVRDRTMLELFYSTGLRRTELCRLELADLNTDRRTLHVRLGKGKKARMVPVGSAGRRFGWNVTCRERAPAQPGHPHPGLVPHRLRRAVQSGRGQPHGE